MTMLDITDKSYSPRFSEINEYIANPVFDELCRFMQLQFNSEYEIAYSGDKALLGWNLRFVKSGKTLCRIYPRRGCFGVLLVVGQKEKQRVEALLPRMSPEMQEIYAGTREGMGQRWMVFEINKTDGLYCDLLEIIRIRLSRDVKKA